MRTKDFIKMLQEADPSGEAFVRIDGGAIVFCEKKAGYWDGPYEYIENDKFIISTRHDKVDIRTTDYEDWIYNHDGDYSSIELDFTYISEVNKEKENRYQKKFEEASKEYKRFEENSLWQFTFKVLEKVQQGWEIIQPKDTKIGHYNVHSYKKGLEKKKLCQGECGAVIKSGFFKPVEINFEIHWELKI